MRGREGAVIMVSIPLQLTWISAGFNLICLVQNNKQSLTLSLSLSLSQSHLPSCCTDECSSCRSRLFNSSNRRKPESNSSTVPPSSPRSFALASRSWTSSSVLLPPDRSPTLAKAGPMMDATGSGFAGGERRGGGSL